LPLTTTDRAGAEGFSAFAVVSPSLIPEEAVISFVAPQKVLSIHACTVGSRRNPTAAIYNLYKVWRAVIDRPDLTT
jgi:hypothetical protein